MPTRYDAGSLRAPVRDAAGFLRVDGHLTRVGIFEYLNADGSIRREYRPESEVMHADSLASFRMVPVTNDHPPGLLTAANAREYQVGSTGEGVRKDGDHVAAPLIVTDATTISDVEAGKRDLSCGYTCDWDPTPGEWHGQRYDGVQRNIRGNHVAIVSRGRAGSASLRLDNGDAVMVSPDRHDGKEVTMKIKINGVEVEVADTTGQLIEAERRDAAEKLAAALKNVERESARADAAEEAKKAAEKARNDAADPKVFEARVTSRVDLMLGARSVLGSVVKLDGADGKPLSDRDVRIKVLAKLAPDLKLVDANGKPRSDDYVQARYDIALEAFDKENPALAEARRAAENVDDKGQPRNDADDPEEAARARMIKEGQNAYKPKQR